MKVVLTKPVVGVQLDTRIAETLPRGSEIEVSQNSPGDGLRFPAMVRASQFSPKTCSTLRQVTRRWIESGEALAAPATGPNGDTRA